MYCAVTTVDVAHAINVGQNSTRASELVMEVSIKYSQVLGARDKRWRQSMFSGVTVSAERNAEIKSQNDLTMSQLVAPRL